MRIINEMDPVKAHLQVGQRILLAVAWCRLDERRLFELFPEVLMMDVTFSTNREGRPLATTCAFDQNMTTFVPMRAFLPSQCQWVFQWILEKAMPALLGRGPLRRMQLFLTDGDSNIYRPFDLLKSTLFPNATHGLCVYHILTKPLSDGLVGDLRDRRRNPDVDAMIATFKSWVMSWTNIQCVETKEEFEISFANLENWLASFKKNTAGPGE
jgi:hypothetical protein